MSHNARFHLLIIGLFLLSSPIAFLSRIASQDVTAEPETTPAIMAGKFVDITQAVGIRFQHMAPHTSQKYLIETMGSGVALFDCDNDGRLDLYAINGAPYRDPKPKGFIPRKVTPEDWNRMYHQTPDGTFEDITAKAGLQGVGYGMGVAVADYDNDGFEDIYVTVYGGNHLYHNNGNCTFTDVTEKAGVEGSGWSSSAAWVDLDNDGLLDLVVLRYVAWDWNDLWCGPPDNRGICHPDNFPPIAMLVYHNDGNGHFTEVEHKLGLDKPAKALGIAIGDYDKDGRIDLFVSNDSMPEFLFHQKADGSFEEVGLESGVAVNGDGRTYAGMGVDFADYDAAVIVDITGSHTPAHPGFAKDIAGYRRDVGERLALLVAVVSTNGGTIHVLRNETLGANHWITLKLVGHKSNRDGIGALVKVTTTKGSQWGMVTSAGSYLSSNDLRAHFGLGSAASVQRIEIRWPSGIVQTLSNISGDRILRVDEPSAKQ